MLHNIGWSCRAAVGVFNQYIEVFSSRLGGPGRQINLILYGGLYGYEEF